MFDGRGDKALWFRATVPTPVEKGETATIFEKVWLAGLPVSRSKYDCFVSAASVKNHERSLCHPQLRSLVTYCALPTSGGRVFAACSELLLSYEVSARLNSAFNLKHVTDLSYRQIAKYIYTRRFAPERALAQEVARVPVDTPLLDVDDCRPLRSREP